MYYSIDMNFFYSKDNLVALHFKYDQARRRFVEWARNEIAVVPDFHKRILFSDEAHFWLNGYVNKQNCRIWSEANPQVYVETPLHPEKLTVLSLVYADKPQTLDHLEDNIRRVIADIRPQMLEKVIENWTSRLDYIRASRGSHMPEIIFKISNQGSRKNSITSPSRRPVRLRNVISGHESVETLFLKATEIGRKTTVENQGTGIDSDAESEVNNAAPVLTSSKKSIIKSRRTYLDAHSSGEVDDKLVTPTSLVKMSTPHQKVQCVLWLTEIKSVTRMQRRFRSEWNVDPPTSKSIHQWEITLKETGTLVPQTGKYP
ncbi:DUF4817 domain-containing protein [Trichonephila clavipes]|nr:DUF4817 domain-containing protein [Trichonephila clavipes]